jgi:hypothetical protein
MVIDDLVIHHQRIALRHHIRSTKTKRNDFREIRAIHFRTLERVRDYFYIKDNNHQKETRSE